MVYSNLLSVNKESRKKNTQKNLTLKFTPSIVTSIWEHILRANLLRYH